MIRDECAAGAAVMVAFLTHGSLDRSETAVRAAESRAVLTGLGVAERRIMHLGEAIGAGDGALSRAHAQGRGMSGAQEGFSTARNTMASRNRPGTSLKKR